jgi:hypothetical protein
MVVKLYLQPTYGARLLFFVSARTNKRHHHHHLVPGVILVHQHGVTDLLCFGMLAGATLPHR